MKKTLLTIALIGISFGIDAQEKIQTEVGLKADFVYLNGNVGIGITNPLSQLNIHKNGGSELRLSGNNATSYGELIFSSNSPTYAGYGASISGDGNGVGINVGQLIFKTGYGIVRTERLRITSNGNVGIGTTDPSEKLEINGNIKISGNGKFTGVSGVSDIYIGGILMLKEDGTGQAKIGGVSGGHSTSIYAASSEKIRILANGNVGIGTTTPYAKLDVNGNFKTSGTAIFGDHITNSRPSSSAYLRANNTGYNAISGGTGVSGTGANILLYGKDHTTSANILALRNSIGTGYEMSASLNHNFKNGTAAFGGNVGIGTTTPSTILEIESGDTNGTNHPVFRMTSSDVNATSGQTLGEFQFYNKDADGAHISSYIKALATETYGRKGELTFGTSGVNSTDAIERMRIDSNGNVGIGTATTPTGYMLAVAGKVITEEVKVQLKSSWPDFVFESTYNLPSLEQVEQHIKNKGHLQNIPSAKEVAKNGILLGDMNAKLLQKIEELTLYTIAQEKKINSLEAQKSRIEKLEKENQILKSLAIRLTKLEKSIKK